MGKKKVKRRNYTQESRVPFVSVCTPTFNRRPFMSAAIQCFLSQDYPQDRMEWLIYDDGTDKIEDLVKDIKNVKYFKTNDKRSLGSKRNFLHLKSKGDILVYMDDDDYYPPCRVSHAVETLQANPDAMVAGSSELYIYFNEIAKIYQFGPYGPNHATAGTFAIRKSYIKNKKYESDAALAEEKAFLNNYTTPLVQLDPVKTILVVSHNHNTFDKRILLKDIDKDKFIQESDKTVETFITNSEVADFYTKTIHEKIKTYDAGKPEMKPDVLKQMNDLLEKREKHKQKTIMQNNMAASDKIIEMQGPNGEKKTLNVHEIAHILKMQQEHIQKLNKELNDTKTQLQNTKLELEILKSNVELEQGIEETS